MAQGRADDAFFVFVHCIGAEEVVPGEIGEAVELVGGPDATDGCERFDVLGWDAHVVGEVLEVGEV
jgi:hypothetical protein